MIASDFRQKILKSTRLFLAPFEKLNHRKIRQLGYVKGETQTSVSCHLDLHSQPLLHWYQEFRGQVNRAQIIVLLVYVLKLQ